MLFLYLVELLKNKQDKIEIYNILNNYYKSSLDDDLINEKNTIYEIYKIFNKYNNLFYNNTIYNLLNIVLFKNNQGVSIHDHNTYPLYGLNNWQYPHKLDERTLDFLYYNKDNNEYNIPIYRADAHYEFNKSRNLLKENIKDIKNLIVESLTDYLRKDENKSYRGTHTFNGLYVYYYPNSNIIYNVKKENVLFAENKIDAIIKLLKLTNKNLENLDEIINSYIEELKHPENEIKEKNYTSPNFLRNFLNMIEHYENDETSLLSYQNKLRVNYKNIYLYYNKKFNKMLPIVKPQKFYFFNEKLYDPELNMLFIDVRLYILSLIAKVDCIVLKNEIHPNKNIYDKNIYPNTNINYYKFGTEIIIMNIFKEDFIKNYIKKVLNSIDDLIDENIINEKFKLIGSIVNTLFGGRKEKVDESNKYFENNKNIIIEQKNDIYNIENKEKILNEIENLILSKKENKENFIIEELSNENYNVLNYI